MVAPAIFSAINLAIQSTHGVVNLPFYNLAIDITSTEFPSVTNEMLQLWFNGTVFNSLTGENTTQEGQTVLNLNSTYKNSIQVLLSAHLFNTAFEWAYNTNLAQYNVTPDLIPPNIPIKL